MRSRSPASKVGPCPARIGCTRNTVSSISERDAADVVKAVANGAAVGIMMRPLPLESVLHADELGALLPFGSTAFHPPLANLIALVIDADEDLV